MITTYAEGTKERTALEAAAALLEVASPNGTPYFVEDTYFDAGQDWKWTTIVAYGKNGTWQALNPREHELITDIGTVEAIFQAVESVRNDKYNPDK